MLDNLKISLRARHKGNKSHKPELKADNLYLIDWTNISIGQKPRANRELKQPGTTSLTRTREFAHLHVHFHIFLYISQTFSSNQRREMTFFAIVFVWTK